MQKRFSITLRVGRTTGMLCCLLLPRLAASSSVSGDFVYEALDATSAQITGYTGAGGFVRIPANLQSYSVRGIGVGAFAENASVSDLHLPATVTIIGSNAFRGCTGLVSIIVDGALTELGSGAFSDTPNLKSVLFTGPTPPTSGNSTNTTAVMFYHPNSEGWGTSFAGRPAAPMAPVATGASITANGGFSFSWSGAGDIPMDIEQSDSLGQGPWVRVAQGIRGRYFNITLSGRSASFYRAKPARLPQPIALSVAGQIREFTGGWGKGAGSGLTVTQREFEFTPCVVQHSGPDWDDLLQQQDGTVTAGSYRNMLKFLFDVSGWKILAGHNRIATLRLAEDTVFAVKPPVLFFGGSSDFVLSSGEVANLARYLRLGGAVWGESSQATGGSTAFDTAFRREMRRVMGALGTLSEFVPLHSSDAVLTRDPYFPSMQDHPPGLAGSRHEISVMRYLDEVSVIHSRRGYFQLMLYEATRSGNSWSFAPPVNWSGAPIPAQPVSDTLLDVYKLSSNLILYLVTRWEHRLADSPRL
jgi:hypothetical protein